MPRKLYWLAAITATQLTIGQSMHAEVLASDDFSYPNGELLNPKNNGGTGFAGAWGDEATTNGNKSALGYIIKNGVVTKVRLKPFSLYRGFSPKVVEKFRSSNEIWISFDLTRDRGSWSGIQFFAGTDERLLIGANGSNSANWEIKGKTSLGKGPGGTIPTNAQGAAKAIVRLSKVSSPGKASADLWVVHPSNSEVDLSQTPTLATKNLTLNDIDTVRIGSSGHQTLDNFLVGETASDVCSHEPEPQESLDTATLIQVGGISLILR